MTGSLSIPPAIKRGFVRILKADHPVGCGFLIANRIVCSCTHVVAQALGQPWTLPTAPTTPVYLDFPRLDGPKPLTARVMPDGWLPLKTEAYRREDGLQDIALLMLDGPPPEGAHPLDVATPPDVWQHSFGAYGYPEERPAGVWVTGRLLETDDIGLIQIEDIKQTGYVAQPGFSGTPVWDSDVGVVVGMIVLTEPEPKKRVGFAIPVAAIGQLKPGILADSRRRTSVMPAPMSDLSEYLTRDEWLVYEVAFLWHGHRPPSIEEHWYWMTPDIEQTKQMLHQAINTGKLRAVREYIGPQGGSRHVSRADLKEFAALIGERPSFLFCQ